MASSQLKSASQLPPDSGVGSGQGSAFPFAWRAPVVQGSETVITTLRPSTPTPPADGAIEQAPDLVRRLFPTTGDADDVSGVRVGHFTIQRRVGVGGMGSVFLATDERLRRNVALKVLAPSLTADTSSVQRFQNEARAAARLDHDNIARVFYYGDDAGLHYIAYEYVAGSNLRDVIRLKGKLDPTEAVNYAMQLAAAISHTSAAGVVHRDIKPSNVLITPQGRAKLVDLGLARKESLDASAELTVAGTTLGTFDYISPEQAKDPRNVDVRSDIYSLGCTLYHMLTGEPPYPEGTVLQKLLDHQGKDAPDPARKNRRVSPALSSVVRKMMASDPRRRYATPGELLRELLQVARSLGSGAVPIDGQVWLAATRFEQPYWQRNIGWIATAGALILLVVAMERFPSLMRRFDPRTTTASTLVNDASQAPSVEKKRLVPEASGSQTDDSGQPSSVGTLAQSMASQSTVTQPDFAPGATQGPPFLSEEPGEIQPSVIPRDFKSVDEIFGPVDASSTDISVADRIKDVGTLVKSQAAATVPSKEEPTGTAATARAPAKESNVSTTIAGSADANPLVSIVGGKTYGSLESACAEAKDGSIIELRYNGRRGESERPIRLSNKKSITVRGGLGFRPLIEFAPTEPPTDPTQSRMITVTGGALELVNVDLMFKVPERIAADRWVLFSLERPKELQLHGVNITVVNPNGLPACVIEQVAAPGQGLGNVGMMKNGMPTEPPKMLFTESLVRGECDLIVLRDAVPARFQLRDVLVALHGSLFHAICQTEMAGTETDRVAIELELDHVTCLLSDSLILTEGIDNLTDHTPPLNVISRNSVFSCGPNRPLIAMKDAGDLMDMQRQFFWNGDRNYYDSLTTFWQLGGRQSSAMSRQLDFNAWRNYWGSNEGIASTNAPVIWRTKPLERPWAKMSAAAVELDSTSNSNPPLNGASDGKDAGVTLSKLPLLPVDERAAVGDDGADEIESPR